MRNLFSRMVLVCIALPALYAIIVCLPQFGHGATVLVAVVFSAGCGVEISRLFSSKGIPSHPFRAASLAVFPPVLLWALRQFFQGSAGESLPLFVVGVSVSFMIALSPLAFSGTKDGFSQTLVSVASTAFSLLYPGLFSSAIVLIASYPEHSTQAILWFALLVFGNDSAAWAVGMLFGRHRGVVTVSPNKSLEGFLGAFAGSFCFAFAGPAFFPGVVRGDPVGLLVLGFFVGIAVVVGDLFESALKRSAGAKDSGTTIPGRGGFLDSFDSILFAAPIYYLVIQLFNLL